MLLKNKKTVQAIKITQVSEVQSLLNHFSVLRFGDTTKTPRASELISQGFTIISYGNPQKSDGSYRNKIPKYDV